MPSVSQKQANLMSAIKHGWHPPAGMHAPPMAVAQEFHAADKKAGKYEHAEGGLIDNAQHTQDMLNTRVSPPATRSDKFFDLISHAADRATSTVTDDPHHALARVASGLASQVAGLSPSGRAQFGRRPNMVDEIKSLPAGIADIGTAGATITGGLSDKYFPNAPGTTLPGSLSRLRDALNNLIARKGDIAPAASREAEERSGRVHQAVNRSMDLSAPHGMIESGADALGTMLGQIPLPLAEGKTAVTGVKGGLSALLHAVPEYLGPTIRPSLRNYAAGTLGGGALGTLSSMGDEPAPPPVADTGMMKEKFQ